MLSIVIAGDIYPGPVSAPYLKTGNISDLFGGLEKTLRHCDLRIANLEGPLTNERSPIQKIGPLHSIDEECVAGIKAAGFDVLSLANNHIMDHGSAGLQNTLRACERSGISCVGAAENLQRAGQLLVKEVKGIRVGILSYTEHEFGIATKNEWGANPLDLIHFVNTVKTGAGRWDYLLILLHGGNEYYPFPRPKLRETCRFMVEQGAGAVICQHSHCPGCYETHQGGHIIYGQGNFLFDDRSMRDCEQEGFLVQFEIEGPGASRMELIPYAHSNRAPGPVRMSAQAEQQFKKALAERSAAILKDNFVEETWSRFCQEKKDNYLALLHGYSRRVREWDRKLRFLRFFYSRERLRMLLHLIRCESHRETLIQVLSSAAQE